jgi:RNA polymerase sigma-70 factor (ECF subfamily)
VQPGDPGGEGATLGARGEVRVDRRSRRAGILPVQLGGQRGATTITVHVEVVVAAAEMVPGDIAPPGTGANRPVLSAAVDELTRLLVAGRDGDRMALAAAIRRSQPEVWRLAAHLVGRAEADDVIQEAFLRAYRALPGFRAEASARTWLLAIARRTCADAVRRARRHRRLHERITGRRAARDDAVCSDDGSVCLDDLVARLDNDRRTAFVLTQVLGCSYHEAAEVCDAPVGTIRSRVARARADLVEQMRAAESA